MAGATVEALRRYRAGEPASPSAPVAIVQALRDMRERNAAADAQHLQDLQTLSSGGLSAFDRSKFSPEQQQAFTRATQQVGDAMDVGGLTAWHGTHAGNILKFDPKKIGTGEGAQVYGQGLYLAGSKDVANQYRRQVPTRHLSNRMAEDAQQGYDTSEIYRSILTDPSVPRDQKRLVRELGKDDWLGFDYPHQAMREIQKNPQEWDLLPRTQQAVGDVGNLYKVDLPDEHVANMLNWDHPLTAQYDKMRKIEDASNLPENGILRQSLDAFHKRQAGLPDRQLGGGAFVNAVIDKAPNVAAETAMANDMSRALRDAGIPGTQYLDAGSRRNRGGMSSNYVIYPGNEGILTIQERNGIPLNAWGSTL